MEERPLTAADVGAVVNHGNGYGCNGTDEWIWIIVLFALFGGNGFGWGNNRGNGVTSAELQTGFDNQTTQLRLDSISNGQREGFYTMNTAMLQGQNMLQRDICQGVYSINSNIAENRFATQNCCCETNRNIDAVRYENAKNTCDIVTAINADGEKTRAVLIANQIQDLRDKVVEKDQALQTANFQLSQQAQSANLISALRPTPQPAYLTCSPYQSTFYAYNGFNGGYGCNGCM